MNAIEQAKQALEKARTMVAYSASGYTHSGAMTAQAQRTLADVDAALAALSAPAQMTDAEILDEGRHWLNVDHAGWDNVVAFARAIESRALSSAAGQEPVAHILCGDIEQTTQGTEIGDFDLEWNMREAERINAANPGKRIALYAAPAKPQEQPQQYVCEHCNGIAGGVGADGVEVDCHKCGGSGYEPQEQPVAAQQPELTVWYGPMPESNGKSNFTAILMRKGGDFNDGHTIDRSEYPERVRYEADRVRYLLGELDRRPFILDYDANKHSGYVPPAAPVDERAARAIDALDGMGFKYDEEIGWLPPQQEAAQQQGARVAFEAWATGAYSLNKRKDGTYYEPDTASAWAIWQDAQEEGPLADRVAILEGLLAAVVEARYGYGQWPSEEVIREALAAAPAQPQEQPVAAQQYGQSFDAAWDSIDWDKWRDQPIRELVRHLHTLTAGQARELLAELDWCIENGNTGPRSHKALVAARAALAQAPQQEAGQARELLAELDWCIENGNTGPRSHKALVAARSALAAPAQQVEAEIRDRALEEAAEAIEAAVESIGDAASYDNRDLYPAEAERIDIAMRCANTVRSLKSAAGSNNGEKR